MTSITSNFKTKSPTEPINSIISMSDFAGPKDLYESLWAMPEVQNVAKIRAYTVMKYDNPENNFMDCQSALYEACVRQYRSQQVIRDPKNFAITAIVNGTARGPSSKVRKEDRTVRFVGDYNKTNFNPVHEAGGPAKLASDRDEVEKMHDIVLSSFDTKGPKEVDPETRWQMLLAHMSGLTIPEIAKEFNIQLNTAKTRIHRTLAAIKRCYPNAC